MLDSMNSLKKLRLIRRQHARDRSQYPRENDPVENEFLDEIGQLEDLVRKQNTTNENERRKLIGIYCAIK
jgi:hypothetical protein